MSQTNENYPLSEAQIAQYQRDGFIQLNDVFTGTDLDRLRSVVEEAVRQETASETRTHEQKGAYEQIFIQKVNLWRRHESVKKFALCKRLGDLAARLSGQSVRIWHDQALFKEPRQGANTPWHQDAPYWPHHDPTRQLTVWIALKDATIQNGCMSFIPGTQVLTNVEPIKLWEPQNIFELAPQFKGVKAQTCELKAGSCTFHNGLTFHYAGPNKSDGMREAYAIIFMPEDTRYTGEAHIVTDPLGLKKGDVLDGEVFPLVGRLQK